MTQIHEDQIQKMKLLAIDDEKYRTTFTKKYENRKPYEPHDPKKIRAFIPGTIKNLYVKPGSKVKVGDQLFILEAMKMNNIILAPMDGVIKKVNIEVNKTVANKEILIEFE